jgi:uncharacterized protein (TIGR02646 family)
LPEVRITLRRQVRQRYGGRCGYCGVTELDSGAELTIDHFQPQIAWGTDALTNLVYCCHACNGFKGEFWNPDLQAARRLLHPLRDRPEEHFSESETGELIARTETGDFHIEKLHLNRPLLIGYRQKKRRNEQVLRENLVFREQIEAYEEELRQLIERLRHITS